MAELAYIIDHVRTPRARRKGKFSSVHPVDLLTYPLNALKDRTKIPLNEVDDVIIGCVTQVGEQAWCVGRAAVLAAGWPDSTSATTVNRLCGSGQQAMNFGALAIMSGVQNLVVTGGLEHMTRCPMFSDTGGEPSPLLDKHYPDLVPQGLSAELLAKEYNLSRNQLDQFAYESQMKAKAAIENGCFKNSLVEVPYCDENGKMATLKVDDTVRGDTTVEGLSKLKPAFREDGVITAGNASAIVDGAATILLASEQRMKALGLKPRAIIRSISSVGSPPRIMLTGPVEASRRALKQAGLTASDINVWEINEAFAPVPLFATRELEINPACVNPNGGGISLGHPLGATGAMLVGMAVDELERTNSRYALVTMCIGLGMGIATVIERT